MGLVSAKQLVVVFDELGITNKEEITQVLGVATAFVETTEKNTGLTKEKGRCYTPCLFGFKPELPALFGQPDLVISVKVHWDVFAPAPTFAPLIYWYLSKPRTRPD